MPDATSTAAAGPTFRTPQLLPNALYSTPPDRASGVVRTAEQEEKYAKVLEHVSAEDYSPLAKEGEEDRRGLDEVERMFLSKEQIYRFLKATKWKVDDAIKRIDNCMTWRRTFNMYDVRGVYEVIAPECESGKVVITGWDRKSRPISYNWQKKNVLTPSPRQVQHILYMMERTVDLLPAGVEQVMFCADLSGKSQSSSGAMGVSRQILSALQNHYPERLGAACVLGLPWLGSLFLTLLLPFVDPDTRRKIYINPDLSKELIAKEQLLDEYGGTVNFEYGEEFMPALVDLCVQRREANLERFRAAGGKVGTSEWDILEPFTAGGTTPIANGGAENGARTNGVTANGATTNGHTDGVARRRLPTSAEE